MESSKQLEKVQQKEDEPNEVSYTLLKASSQTHTSDILQKVATAINVQLTLENGQALPIISPNDFDNVKHQDKLFIYGPSGCGKSRCIYEILKDKLKDTENIFIINPRQSIGEESGRVTIRELVNRLNQKDIVVWDNFPDDLLIRDVESGRKALEILSVKDVKNFLVALKPKYLEAYRGLTSKNPELYDYEIAYDKEKIKGLIISYGRNIIQFTEIYEKYVLPAIHQISTILWQKESLPLTILAYYREMKDKQNQKNDLGGSLDYVLEAEKLMRRTEYYKHQFALIRSLDDRQNDIEFLYTLKLCYELRLIRTPALICQLQKGIFDSIPPKEPSRKLRTWVYLYGQHYAMHDTPGDAIQFSKDVKLRIISYLTENFSEVIPKEDDQIYSFGIFFGRNIDLIACDTPYDFLPAHVYDYMKSKWYFEFGLGEGTGEIFPSLDYHMQDQILRRLEIDGEFAKGLGDGLGLNFLSLDKERQFHILEGIIRKSIPFARGLGESLGHEFTKMPQQLREEIFRVLLIKENFQFARGLGMGLGFTFLQLDKQVQRKIFDFTNQSVQFAIGVGYGLGNNFTSLPKEFQHEIFELAEKNSELTRGLGIGLGNNFTSLPKEFQHEIFELAEKNIQFAYGLGYQIGYNFNYMNKEQQKELFVKIGKNSEFSSGISLGLGITFTYLSKGLQEKIFRLTEENIQFAYGLGYGFGFVFKYLPQELSRSIPEKIERNSEFAKGLGYGLGYTFSFFNKDFQKDAFVRAEENSQFAYGLGVGTGIIYEHMPANLQREIFKRAEENSQFSRGVGDGSGYAFSFKNQELQEMLFGLTEENAEFAIGLGIGLRYSFVYFSTEFQDKIYGKAKHNMQFAYGLGLGLGYVFVYLKENLKNDVFRIAERNSQFALGFGVGLSNLFTFMNEDFRDAMFKKAVENTQFTRGLGIGLGKVFPFLDKEFQSKLFAQAQKDVEFAIGLGEGFGHIFVYLKKELRNKILEDLSKQSDNENGETSGIQDNNNKRNGNGFNRGLGIGLGKNFPYVMKDLEFRIFAKAAINTQFAIGLGEGFGHIFSYVDNELQDRILQKSNERSLARGLGIGLSHVLHYFNNKEELQNRIFKETNTNKVLAKSLGSCLNFLWLKHYNLLEKILTKAEQNSEFAEGICMKEDFDNDVKLLNRESQDVCKHLVKKCGYNENKFSFNDYPIIGFPSNTYYHCTNQKNGVDDQNVIDDEMKEYLQMVLDEMKNKNKNDKNV